VRISRFTWLCTTPFRNTNTDAAGVTVRRPRSRIAARVGYWPHRSMRAGLAGRANRGVPECDQDRGDRSVGALLLRDPRRAAERQDRGPLPVHRPRAGWISECRPVQSDLAPAERMPHGNIWMRLGSLNSASVALSHSACATQVPSGTRFGVQQLGSAKWLAAASAHGQWPPEPADREVHQVFDEIAVERLPVRRLSAALTANSADAL
jgi:hypothetical protein